MKTKLELTLLDGGMGRELKRMGAPFRQPEWSALALSEAPEMVGKAHQAFIDAGSQVITTNNYAVAPFHLGRERFNTEGERLTDVAGSIARAIANKATSPVWVAGSIPPLYGSYRPDLFDIDAAKRDLPTVLQALSPYVDMWLAETVSSIAEFVAIVNAFETLNTDQMQKPLWVSFTLKDERIDGRSVLRSGEGLDEALQAVQSSRAEAVLFNCSQPEYISDAIAIVSKAVADSPLRFGGYANAFSPRGDSAQANEEIADLRGELTPELYLESFVTQWIDRGASIVGGCCGLGPEHITAIEQWKRNNL